MLKLKNEKDESVVCRLTELVRKHFGWHSALESLKLVFI